MLEYPQIPIFVLQELSSNPNRMPQIIREMGMDPELAAQKLARDGKVPSGDYHQFFLNVLSLCIFPFAARPVVTEILYKGDSGSFSEAMKRRKKELPQLVRNMLSQKTAP
jgi:TetR/AcrR family transcriptional regulator